MEPSAEPAQPAQKQEPTQPVVWVGSSGAAWEQAQDGWWTKAGQSAEVDADGRKSDGWWTKVEQSAEVDADGSYRKRHKRQR